MKIKMSNKSISTSHKVKAYKENGERISVNIAGEVPLTIKLNNKEIVTLMTLGSRPEELTLGYLRNQKLIENVNDIKSVIVDWDLETANVTTFKKISKASLQKKLKNKTVTTGCGQGTIFSCTLDKLYDERLPNVKIKNEDIFNILKEITKYNEMYKKAGAVHGCAICTKTNVLEFIEDVGRHNAADTLSGIMWLKKIDGLDKIFYTTGRLTSEIVMKVKNMNIPILLSRSGITNMGLELAKDLNVTMIARATQRSFVIYNNKKNVITKNVKKI